jgi:putative membrane protein
MLALLIAQSLGNAAALWVAVRLVPDFHFPAAETFPNGDWWELVVVALILGLVNAFVKPVLRALSWPIVLLTLGLFSLVINAAVVLLVAWLSDALDLGVRVAGFPPTLDSQAVVTAILASVVISLVSLAVTWLVPVRPTWRTRLAL